MKNFYGNKEDAVEFVNARLWVLKSGSQLTMTITQASSEDCSVLTVIDGSLEDIALETAAKFFSETQVNT